MKVKIRNNEDFQESDIESEFDETDTDEEFAEKLATGVIKPGLYVEQSAKKPKINDTVKLRNKLEEITLKLDWIERLDLRSELAPLAPELQVQIDKHQQKRENLFKSNAKIPRIPTEQDPVLNDFKREILFHRQAQSAVLVGIKKLHGLGIITKRPDDYFAEMAKTDEHMQKVRANLIAKQEGQAKSERIKQLRQQRKFGKIIEKQAKVKKVMEKKQMIDQLKSYRKGKLKNLDFLDDNKGKQSQNPNHFKKGAAAIKRQMKDKKYGFGGKKSGSKRNTKKSANEFEKPKRLGKSRRNQNSKAKGKKK